MTQQMQDVLPSARAESKPSIETHDLKVAVWPPYLTRAQLRQYLNENGYPISMASLDKLCAPTSKKRPPVARRWGRRDLYDRDGALLWAASLSGPSGG
jgi:hypothetical protein